MVKLLTCSRGHFWESAGEEDGSSVREPFCPVCGAIAETLPLLDLAPTELPPAPLVPRDSAPCPPRDNKGRPVVSGYEILEELGKGPTGVWRYRARQTLTGRLVLLKVVLARDDAGQQAWGSLRSEASALGKITHPLIIPILEAGERDRQIFYNVLETVDGPTLAEKLAGKPLPSKQAVHLLETVARTLQAAHNKGIVHRNLKPASILLQPQPQGPAPEAPPTDCCPLRDGLFLPRLTDFGQARRPVEGNVNDADLQGGPPFYLAPEQAAGRAREIGPGTDVWALGAILYECLTGQPPFRGATESALLDQILWSDTVPPSLLRPDLSPDLQAICLKCLRREGRRRYANARELADDLARYRAGLPVKARLTSNADRLSRWLWRRPALAFTLLLLVLAVTVLPAAYWYGSSSGGSDSKEMTRLRQEMRLVRQRSTETTAQLSRAQAQLRQAQYNQIIAQVEREEQARRLARGLAWLGSCDPALRHWEWYYLQHRLSGGQDRPLACQYDVTSLAYSPGGQQLAASAGVEANAGQGFRDNEGKGEVTTWSLDRIMGETKLTGFDGPVRQVVFSDNGRWLATVSSPMERNARAGEARVYSPNGGLLWKHPFPAEQVTAVAFASEDQSLVVLDREEGLHTLDALNGAPLPQAFPLNRDDFRRNQDNLQLVCLNQGGTRVAHLTRDRQRVAIREGYAMLQELWVPNDAVRCLAGHRDSNRLATGGQNGSVILWDSNTAQSVHHLPGQGEPVTALAFSADGKRLAVCGQTMVSIWDPDTGQQIMTLNNLPGKISAVAFHPNNKNLAVAHGKTLTILGPR